MGEEAKARGSVRPKGVRTAVVETNNLLASGLTALLIRRLGDRSEVLNLSAHGSIGHLRPDILVVGPSWPEEDVPRLLRDAFESPSRTRAVLIVSEDSHSDWTPGTGHLVRISERCDSEVLLSSVEAMLATHEPMKLRNGATQQSRLLSLIQQGLTNREIAARLFLAESTVKWHISKLMRSLGARNRTELSRLGHAPTGNPQARRQGS